MSARDVAAAHTHERAAGVGAPARRAEALQRGDEDDLRLVGGPSRSARRARPGRRAPRSRRASRSPRRRRGRIPRARSSVTPSRLQARAREHAVGRRRRLAAGLHEQETAGAERDLGLAGLEAALPEERRLLVAEHAHDRQPGLRRRPKTASESTIGGRSDAGTPNRSSSSSSQPVPPSAQSIVRPALLGLGHVRLTARQRVGEPRCDIAVGELAGLGGRARRPARGRAASGSCWPGTWRRARAPCARARAARDPRRRAPRQADVERRSCQTIAGWIGRPARALPDHEGLGLVRDRERRDVARRAMPAAASARVDRLDGGGRERRWILLDEPGLPGYDAGDGHDAPPAARAASASNAMQRVLDVPWSSARRTGSRRGQDDGVRRRVVGAAARPAAPRRPARRTGGRPRTPLRAASQPSAPAISAATAGARGDAAVAGLERDPRAPGEHVLEPQRTLVRAGVDHLDAEVLVRALERLGELGALARSARRGRRRGRRSDRAAARSAATSSPSLATSAAALVPASAVAGRADDRDASVRDGGRTPGSARAASTRSFAITR